MQLTCVSHGYPEPTLLWSGENATGSISCECADMLDAESGIIRFTVSIGTDATDQSILSEMNLAGDSSFFVSPQLNVSVTMTYYVTLRIGNSAGLETILTSDPVYFDNSPPIVEGFTVTVLPNSLLSQYDMSNFSTEFIASPDTLVCLLNTDVAVIVFDNSADPETGIISRYVLHTHTVTMYI